jgi:hypothetical protein
VAPCVCKATPGDEIFYKDIAASGGELPEAAGVAVPLARAGRRGEQKQSVFSNPRDVI